MAVAGQPASGAGGPATSVRDRSFDVEEDDQIEQVPQEEEPPPDQLNVALVRANREHGILSVKKETILVKSKDKFFAKAITIPGTKLLCRSFRIGPAKLLQEEETDLALRARVRMSMAFGAVSQYAVESITHEGYLQCTREGSQGWRRIVQQALGGFFLQASNGNLMDQEIGMLLLRRDNQISPIDRMDVQRMIETVLPAIQEGMHRLPPLTFVSSDTSASQSCFLGYSHRPGRGSKMWCVPSDIMEEISNEAERDADVTRKALREEEEERLRRKEQMDEDAMFQRAVEESLRMQADAAAAAAGGGSSSAPPPEEQGEAATGGGNVKEQ